MSDTNTATATPSVADKVKATFKAARNTALEKNGHTRFAEAEQLAVIEALVDLLVNDEAVALEGYGAIAPAVAAVANASSFAQTLEKNGIITRNKKGGGGSKAEWTK